MTESSKTSNEVYEGSGSHKQGLHKTTLGRWLTLFRIQSIPISSVVVSIGYLMAVETLLVGEILGLITVAAVAHAGVNAQNDALDYHTDLRNKAEDKPLIAGDITQKEAIFMSSILVAFSVLIGYSIFPQSFWLLALSILAATLYNIYSSKKWWSMFLFGLWGLLFSMYGFSVGSSNGILGGLPLALSFGVMMTSYIFLGDILDADAHEETAVKMLGGEVTKSEGGDVVFTPMTKIDEVHVTIFFAAWTGLLIFENVNSSSVGMGPAIITALMGFATYEAVKMSCYTNLIDDHLKKTFLIYVITTSTALLIAYSPSMNILYTLLMFMLSLIWATVVMKIMYGSWLYFP